MNLDDLLLYQMAVKKYGRSGKEILSTCRLYLEVQNTWKQEDIDEFKKLAKIPNKTWNYLIDIANDKRLYLIESILPSKINSIIVLTSYTDKQLEIAAKRGIINPKISYRLLQNWKRR